MDNGGNINFTCELDKIFKRDMSDGGAINDFAHSRRQSSKSCVPKTLLGWGKYKVCIIDLDTIHKWLLWPSSIKHS